MLFILFGFFCIRIEAKGVQKEFFIVDSWLTGFAQGLAKNKEKRWHMAWKNAGLHAKNDIQIWGGLFATDTNLTGGRRFMEFLSRHTYQAPQTYMGFLTAHAYNTILCKVNTVSYANGTTVLNMNVNWPGICFGTYILAKNTIEANPNNRLFQHEYGHYLQSKRMGLAYLVRIGLPAIMSTGNHDEHPVEIDCNREAFIYFNLHDVSFKQDSILYDKKGWNFLYNPFPDSVGETRHYAKFNCVYVDYSDSLAVRRINTLKVRAKWLDYASWIVFPAPVVVGLVNARNYNKRSKKVEQTKTAISG